MAGRRCRGVACSWEHLRLLGSPCRLVRPACGADAPGLGRARRCRPGLDLPAADSVGRCWATPAWVPLPCPPDKHLPARMGPAQRRVVGAGAALACRRSAYTSYAHQRTQRRSALWTPAEHPPRSPGSRRQAAKGSLKGIEAASYRGSPVPVAGTDGAPAARWAHGSAMSPGSANLGNLTDATLRACGSGPAVAPILHLAGACACRTKSRRECSSRLCRTTPPSGASGAAWDCSSWSWSAPGSGDVVQLVGGRAGDGELADRFVPPRVAGGRRRWCSASPGRPSSRSPRPYGCWSRRWRPPDPHDSASRWWPVARTARRLCSCPASDWRSRARPLEGRRPHGSTRPC
jgi:hypothetical protein